MINYSVGPRINPKVVAMAVSTVITTFRSLPQMEGVLLVFCIILQVEWVQVLRLILLLLPS